MDYTVQLPTQWDELTDGERLLLFRLLHRRLPPHELRTALLLHRLAPQGYHYDHAAQILTLRRPGRKALQIPAHQLDQAADAYAFLDTPPPRPCPPSQLMGCTAIAPLLQEVPFRSFLALEFLWQNLLALSPTTTADADQPQSPEQQAAVQELLQAIAAQLYPGIDAHRLPSFFGVIVFHWLGTMKHSFAQRWAALFQRQSHDPHQPPTAPHDAAQRAEAANNAMLRALTRGDLTKENLILDFDTWRALEELNQLAREAQSLNTKSAP